MTLLGQDGADTIGGGTGFDYLYGGAEADLFVFNKGDSYDTVRDFSVAEGDKLRIDPALAGSFAEFQSRLYLRGSRCFSPPMVSTSSPSRGIAHTACMSDMLVA